jgi:hypothetical protein
VTDGRVSEGLVMSDEEKVAFYLRHDTYCTPEYLDPGLRGGG